MQSKGKKLKNNKKDCSICSNHGICLAEINTERYVCPLTDNFKELEKKYYGSKFN